MFSWINPHFLLKPHICFLKSIDFLFSIAIFAKSTLWSSNIAAVWGPQSIAFRNTVFQWLNLTKVYGRYNELVHSIHGDTFMVYKPTFTSLGGLVLWNSSPFTLLISPSWGWFTCHLPWWIFSTGLVKRICVSLGCALWYFKYILIGYNERVHTLIYSHPRADRIWKWQKTSLKIEEDKFHSIFYFRMIMGTRWKFNSVAHQRFAVQLHHQDCRCLSSRGFDWVRLCWGAQRLRNNWTLSGWVIKIIS